MEPEYIPTIGLEIHAELKTKTKMFCACKNNPDEEMPNVNICPVCMGHPGTLPVINKEAVKNIIKVGVAVGGKIAEKSEFDRKNYFYPDIPKGYQISQYKHPLVSGGEINGIRLTRIHLEEDTASSSHQKGGFSLVNFNRAGVPLLELVTEPVIHSASEASKFGEELQLLLKYLGVSDANMEKGEMRLEANISVAPKKENISDLNKSERLVDQTNKSVLGTKVEVKNLNSFKSAERAILYEIDRQTTLLKNNEKVKQETRGWDENKQETFPQRSKEDSHDYRYFPDPDLPKLIISEIPEFLSENIKKDLNETPSQMRKRVATVYNIKFDDIEFFVKNKNYFDLFENTIKYLDTTLYQLLSNYIVSDISGLGVSEVNPEHLASLIMMISKGEVSSRGAKIIIPKMVEEKKSPSEIAKSEQLFQKNDEDEIKKIVDEILKHNQSVVSEYKKGKQGALQYLVGQGMKISKGSANPQKIIEIIKKTVG